MDKYKAIFFGSSDFSVPSLEALAENSNIEIQAVLTEPDKKAGRKHVLSENPIAEISSMLNLFLIKEHKLSEETERRLRLLNPDLFIIVSYGHIIPKDILDIPNLGSVNLHPSLLPDYRGPAPIQTAILNGDKKTGISIMLIDEKMDHGPILSQKEASIDKDILFPDLYEKLSREGAAFLNETLNEFLQEKITPMPQDDAKATYTRMISKEDGLMHWKESSSSVYNKYRAYFPWPGIYSFWEKDGKRLKLNLTKISASNIHASFAPGTVFVNQKNIFVKCEDGAIQIHRLQLESKKETDISDFINGHKDFIGSLLI